MTTRVVPDAEAIAIAYLLTRTEVTSLVGDRLGTELNLAAPAQLPALRVGVISQTTAARRHLHVANLQVEAWSSSRIDASRIARTVVGVLTEDGAGSIIGTHPGLGVVTATEEGIGPRPQPDPETQTPRFLATVLIYVHPEPE